MPIPQKKQKELQEAIEAIRNLPASERDKIIRAAGSLKGLTSQEIDELRSSGAFTGCGPCSPCGPQGEIGIESGY